MVATYPNGDYIREQIELPDRSKVLIYQHQRVWIENYGTIPEGCIIHHDNENKKDNRIENLICCTRVEHNTKYHPDHIFKARLNAGQDIGFATMLGGLP